MRSPLRLWGWGPRIKAGGCWEHRGVKREPGGEPPGGATAASHWDGRTDGHTHTKEPQADGPGKPREGPGSARPRPAPPSAAWAGRSSPGRAVGQPPLSLCAGQRKGQSSAPAWLLSLATSPGSPSSPCKDAGLLHNRPKNNPRAGSAGETAACLPGPLKLRRGMGRWHVGPALPGPGTGWRPEGTQRGPPRHLGDPPAESGGWPHPRRPGPGPAAGTPRPGPPVPRGPGVRPWLGLRWATCGQPPGSWPCNGRDASAPRDWPFPAAAGPGAPSTQGGGRGGQSQRPEEGEAGLAVTGGPAGSSRWQAARGPGRRPPSRGAGGGRARWQLAGQPVRRWVTGHTQTGPRLFTCCRH